MWSFENVLNKVKDFERDLVGLPMYQVERMCGFETRFCRVWDFRGGDGITYILKPRRGEDVTGLINLIKFDVVDGKLENIRYGTKKINNFFSKTYLHFNQVVL